MRLLRAVVVSISATAVASSLAAQIPVLGSLEGPYSALQNTQPINLAGNSYSAGQVAYGPVGTPLVLSGSNFGDEGEVWFVSYKNGVVDQNAPYVRAAVTLWSPTAIISSVPAGATSGLVEVVTAGVASKGLPFLVMPGAYSASCPSGPTQNQLQIQTSSLQDGAVSQSYSTTLHATGGSNSYTWTLVSGTLPAGLTLSSSGVISGTPSSASGPVSISVQVADTGAPQQHDAATLSIQIAAHTEALASALPYSFSVGYDSVGNATSETDSVNGIWSFNYDTLNRLANAAGTQPVTQLDTQPDNPYPNYCWQYDSFGNRLSQTSAGNSFSPTAGGPSSSACTVGGGQGPSSWAHYTVTNTNRMDATSQNATQSQYYDASGNITNDGIIAYLYDGEGRICAVQQPIPGVGTTMTQYLYDAEGNRVAKGNISLWTCDTTVNGFTPQSAFVLGPHDEQLTEMTYTTGGWQWAHTNVMASGLSATYDADSSGQTEGELYFHLSDWLGTRRQQTDYAGNPVLNFTGLPYGDGLTTIPVSSTDAADATEHHFTGKERDAESGNDYFGARYYASPMGRFISPDWSAKVMPVPYAKLDNPQSLNLYSYVWNNPLSRADADGHTANCAGANAATCAADLNKLAPGTKVAADGTVSKASLLQRIVNHLNGNGSGTSLVSNIVNSKNLTTITAKDGYTGGGGGTSTPGQVIYNPKGTDVPAYGKDGDISMQHISGASDLGHELIHQDHMNDGSFAVSNSLAMDRTFTTGGGLFRENASYEEFRTVGLKPGSSITEQDIEHQLGDPIRGAYSPPDTWQFLGPQ